MPHDRRALLAQLTTVPNENPETLRKLNEIRELLAREKGVDPKVLIPLFERLGQKGLTLDDMRARAGEAIEALLALARQTVESTRDGADIDATITAARDKLGRLDTAGARPVLATKIAAEDAARRRRLVPLLEEQATIERLSYDYEAAKATLRQLLALEPERVWSWIDLGDLFVTTASRNQADEAYHQARAVAERLAKADPGNAGWQRDLSVSHNKIGDVQRAQGNLPAALTSFQASHDSVEIEQDGRRALLRTAPRPSIDPICRALGITLPPVFQEVPTEKASQSAD